MLVASDERLRELIKEGIGEDYFGESVGALVRADADRGFLALSFITGLLPAAGAYQFWQLAAKEHDPPDSLPFHREAVDAAERALVHDPEEGAHGWLVAHAAAESAEAMSNVGEVDEAFGLLMRTRELLDRSGRSDPAFAMLRALLWLSLSGKDRDLAVSLTRELLGELENREVDDGMRTLLFECAYVIYYEIGDLDLALRCTSLLEDDEKARRIEGFALLRRARWEQALECWNEIAATSRSLEAELNRAAAMHQLGMYDEERDVIDRLTADHPAYWLGHIQRGLLVAGEDPPGDPSGDLEEGFRLAVGQVDERQILEAIVTVSRIATTPELASAVSSSLECLSGDSRGSIRVVAQMTRGDLLGRAGCHEDAAEALSSALSLAGPDDQELSNQIRILLCDALIETDETDRAFEVLRAFVDGGGAPDDASARIERLAGADAADLSLLRAKIHWRSFECAEAEAGLTVLLDDQPDNVEARRLRGMVRLSTAARVDQDQWNQDASVERFIAGIVDLGIAADSGDSQALDAYRWAVDMARGHALMKSLTSRLPRAGDGRSSLIEGMAEADGSNAQAVEAISKRDWDAAQKAALAAASGYEEAKMFGEAGRQHLLSADLAMRKSNPHLALEQLERFDESFMLALQPFEERESAMAHEIRTEAAASGRDGFAVSLDYLVFVGACAGEWMTYRKIIEAQALSAMGRASEALEVLGDERELTEKDGRSPIFGKSGEWVRAVMSILRDAREPGRALALRDRALEEAGDDPARRAAVHATSASCWVILDEPEKALAEVEEARRESREVDNPLLDATIDYQEALAVADHDPARAVSLLTDEMIERIAILPRQAATMSVKADCLADLERTREAEEIARKVEELLAGNIGTIRLPSDRSMSLGAWIKARLLRCEMAARDERSAEALALQAGLKARTLAVQRAIAIAGTRSESPVDEAMMAERDDLRLLIEHAQTNAGAVNWPRFHRLGKRAESLVEIDEAGNRPPELKVAETKKALEDVQGRLAKRQAASAGLSESAAPEGLTDLDELREALSRAPVRTVLVDCLLTDETCYLSGLPSDGEPWTVGVRCSGDEIRRLAEDSHRLGDWSDGDPVWEAPELKRIVEAVQAKTRPGDHIVLIRHGRLHALPLHAVEGSQGLLTERNTVSYGPSSATVLACMDASSPSGKAVVIADSRDDLPQARLEGMAVADLLDVIPIVGSRADRRRVLSAVDAEAPTVLHVACHGHFDSENAEESVLALAGKDVEGTGFAIVNLTARDLAQLRLAGSIVVLSACHSGVSEISSSDEPFGLVRALLAAGARAVVAAQWAVNDLSTWLLFRRFTELCRNDGLTIGDSLAQAQRWLRRLTAKEVATACREALDDGRGITFEIERFLLWQQADYLLGPEEAASARERVDPLAVSRLRAALSMADAGADRRPFADRKYWAAFEVVGDWTSRYPTRQ